MKLINSTVFLRKRKLFLILLDIFAILVSVILARIIRSQFPAFLYSLNRLFLLSPYIIISRLLINIFFEHFLQFCKEFIADALIFLALLWERQDQIPMGLPLKNPRRETWKFPFFLARIFRKFECLDFSFTGLLVIE